MPAESCRRNPPGSSPSSPTAWSTTCSIEPPRLRSDQRKRSSVALGPKTAMSFVATLVSNPAAPALALSALEDARALIPAAGPPDWLFPGVAADIPFTTPAGFDNRALADRVRAAVAPRAIDV